MSGPRPVETQVLATLRLREAASKDAGEWAECARTSIALGARVRPVR